MDDLKARSLAMHELHKGKIEVISKVSVSTKTIENFKNAKL